jgi:hypothetical protein
MRLEIKALGVTAFLILSGAVSHSYAAATAVTHGASCSPANSFDADRALYSRFGVSNVGTGTLNVHCPLENFRGPSMNNDPNQFFATVYDRTSDGDVYCTLFQLDSAGNIVQSVTKNTNSVGLGASSLSFTINNSSSQLFLYDAQCTVPPPGGYGPSYVVSFATYYP